MADKILKFLKYGTSPGTIESVSAEEAEPFLPALVLYAVNNPAKASSVLLPVVSHPRTAQAMAYASVDYEKVKELVLNEMQVDDATEEISADNIWEMDWSSLDASPPDECLEFQQADEVNRAKIVISSLRKSASELYDGTSLIINESSSRVKICKAQGRIWNNEAFIADLLCLLPLAVSYCTDLLTPDVIVKGLLTTKWGALLLTSTLINNPLIQEACIMFLAQYLSFQLKAKPVDGCFQNLSFFQELAASNAFSSYTDQFRLSPIVLHCVQQACWTFVLLCRYIPQSAYRCRDALVKYCTFGGMVIQITAELLHDELEFCSKSIFCTQRTSKWLISSIFSLHKNPMLLPQLIRKGSIMHNAKEMFGCDVGIDCFPRNMTHVIQSMQKSLYADAEMTYHNHGWVGRLCSHLRLYCVLTGNGCLEPTYEEVSFWINALRGEPIASCNTYAPQTVNVERKLCLGIAFLSVAPGLLNLLTTCEFDSCISSLLFPLIMEKKGSSSENELGLWISVQMLLQNSTEIIELVRRTLGIDVAISMSSIRNLCDAAVRVGMISNPCSIAKAVAMLQPIGAVSSDRRNCDFLLKAVNQLMSSGHLQQCAIDIGELVMSFISSSTEPIHPMVVQLIQLFAKSSSLGSGGNSLPRGFRMQPLPCKFLIASFSRVTKFSLIPEKHSKQNHNAFDDDLHGSKSAVTHVRAELMATATLASWYILCREQLLQNAGIIVGCFYDSPCLDLNRMEYEEWSKLCACMPLYQLLVYMEENWIAYEHLFPKWCSLAYHLFPGQLVPNLIKDFESRDETNLYSSGDVPVADDLGWVGGNGTIIQPDSNEECSTDPCHHRQSFLIDRLCKVFGNALEQPLLAAHSLKAIQCEDAENKFEAQCTVMRELVPLLLDASCARLLHNCFCDWWHSLSHNELVSLAPYFMKAIQVTSMDAGGSSCHKKKTLKMFVAGFNFPDYITSYAELVQEPLALLACRPEVYRSPLVSVIINLLTKLLAENRKIHVAGISLCLNDGLKQEEIVGGLALQDCAVCQILLEACLENSFPDSDVETDGTFGSNQLICEFISSLIDANPLLLKLLHFQGYDIKLIPMMMGQVSWMTKCFDFVRELLDTAKATQIVFRVVLAANLVKMYSTHPQSPMVAKQVIDCIKSLQSSQIDASSILIGTLESVAWCAVTFPSLVDEVISLLQACLRDSDGKTSETGAANNAHEAAVAAFKIFIREKILPGRVFP